MNPFTYLEAADVEEALAALAQYGEDAKPIAGGTGLINLMKQQLVQPAYLIGLRRLSELKGIIFPIPPPDQGILGGAKRSLASQSAMRASEREEPASRSTGGEWVGRELPEEKGLRVGALCTLRTLETVPLIMQYAPLLAEASRQVATIRIRSMATLGGALAHADPSEDLPPAMIALDARVRLRSRKSVREIPVAEFFTGYYETIIEPDELVTEVAIPPQPPDTGVAYLKFLPQTHDDYATVAVAARVSLQAERIADVRVALGAVGATPLRAKNLEDRLCGQVPTPAVLQDAAELVADIIDPISDFRGSASYKREMAVVFTRRALARAVAMAQSGEAV